MTTSRSGRKDMGRAVYSLLDDLGREPNEVAASLKGYGIRGQRGSSTDCAVARYLSAVVGGDPSIQSIVVRVQSVRIRSGRRWNVGTRVKVPTAVSRFICAFDQGRYPDLLGEPVRRRQMEERSPQLPQNQY